MAGSTLQMSATPISRVPEQQQPEQQQPEQPALSIEPLDDSFTITEPSKFSTQSPKGIPQQGKWATPVTRSYSPTPQQWATHSFGVPTFAQQGQTTSLLGEYQHHMHCT